MDHDIYGLFEQGLRIRRNADAPGRVRRADGFAQVAAGLGWVFIYGPYDFERCLLPHQTDDRSADRAHAVLRHSNLLFHLLPR